MISNLDDINRVLFAIQQLLVARRRRVPLSLLLEYLHGEVLLGSNPDFEEVIDFLCRLGLATNATKGLGLSNLGERLLSENSNGMFELQPTQRLLLLRNCYLDGGLRREVKQFMGKFVAEAGSGTFVWSALDSEPLEGLEWLGDHLSQLGVLDTDRHFLRVNAIYLETIAQFIDEGGDFTQEQMERYLREQRLLGDIAERFAFEYEQERLRGGGYALEAECVQKTSKIRVNAGYDISSFDGISKNLTHDRFIEVKGSGKASVRFIWTRNEMQKAETLGDRYWIYFIGEINKRVRSVSREPVMLRNPSATLASDKRYRLQPHGNIVVEGSVAGKLLSSPKTYRR